MAHGVPVVATAVGGIPDVVRDRREGYLVPPGDAAALARAMAVLLGDESARRSLAEYARDTVRRRFSPVARADRIFALYEELVGVSAR
jgi:glycosyltransferase involved in cell wall biosynthesis